MCYFCGSVIFYNSQRALFTTSGPRQSTTPSIDQCKQRARRTVREGTSGREESSSMPYTGGGQEGKKKEKRGEEYHAGSGIVRSNKQGGAGH
ncbi:hypothetical protein BDQ94DRAFT_95207 [Aspergillus welwitschiae]|uniref:Uncharacterized protein n=1 Tax=Aspergillus welwitschiae TaxID=1341132 RepID=A0A3F3PR62_9EURO|nr:hypothetical protein BDQ94DRAFT_95207 [Aspergillus welwitschiae]RDH28806.1 hypothetical protein BDQ94DRAFT_95207 [Aspergillus welwitschiae]